MIYATLFLSEHTATQPRCVCLQRTTVVVPWTRFGSLILFPMRRSCLSTSRSNFYPLLRA